MWVFELGTEGRVVINVLTGLSWKVQVASHSSHESSYVYVGLTFQLRVGQRLLYCSTWINKPAARYYSYKDSHGAMNMHNKKKTYE